MQGLGNLMNARLFLEITDKNSCALYLVVDIRHDPKMTRAAYRWHKDTSDEFYTVSQHNEGWTLCTCGDCTWRQRTCKHIKAMKEVGLFK